jgi:hypothetical protein
MRAKHSEVEPKGWGNNAFRVTPANLRQREWERVEMSMSTQRYDTLYKSKEILCMYQEVHGGMEMRSTNISPTLIFISLQYQHNHEEWDEGIDNDELEQMLLQYVKIIPKIKDLEEHAFVTKVVYQTKREHRVKHNILPRMMVGT